MSITVVRDENYTFSASGVHIHLESSLGTKDEVWLLVTPDEPDWEILSQGDPDDPRGLRLVLRRV